MLNCEFFDIMLKHLYNLLSNKNTFRHCIINFYVTYFTSVSRLKVFKVFINSFC